MANLGLKKWVRYIPDIGDNREQSEPLALEVCTGLTRAELSAWRDAISEAKAPLAKEAQRLSEEVGAGRVTSEAAFAALDEATKASNDSTVAVISQHVRLVGKHTIGGRPVETLADYVGVVSELAGGDALRELLAVVPRLNTLTEEDAVFYARLSGGLATTPRRSAAPKEGQTAAQ